MRPLIEILVLLARAPFLAIARRRARRRLRTPRIAATSFTLERVA
jgi:hypothetical protein